MKKEVPFSLTDLLRNDDFNDWVRHPDEQSNQRWVAYLLQFPEQQNLVDMARTYVRVIAENTGKSLPDEQQSTKMWSEILSRLKDG